MTEWCHFCLYRVCVVYRRAGRQFLTARFFMLQNVCYNNINRITICHWQEYRRVVENSLLVWSVLAASCQWSKVVRRKHRSVVKYPWNVCIWKYFLKFPPFLCHSKYLYWNWNKGLHKSGALIVFFNLLRWVLGNYVNT